LNAEKAKDNIF